MKLMRMLSLTLGIAGFAVILICILTDWKDSLLLPLGLFLSAASQLSNILVIRQEKNEEHFCNS